MTADTWRLASPDNHDRATAKGRSPRAPYWLSLPAFLLFTALLLVPIAMTVVLSFHHYSMSTGIVPAFTWQNYVEVLGDAYYLQIFLRTFLLALATTAICVVIGAPEAYIVHALGKRWRGLSLLAILGPLLISVVVRTLGWTILLGTNGLVNKALLAVGLIERPVELLFTVTGVLIALVHVFVPYMVVAVWASLQRIDPAGVQAAMSLGATRTRAFIRTVLPQIMPGILSGSVIVFCLAASAFATPAIIGGRRIKVVATTVYDEYLTTLNWPLGAAIAVTLLVTTVAIVIGWNRMVERRYAQVFA